MESVVPLSLAGILPKRRDHTWFLFEALAFYFTYFHKYHYIQQIEHLIVYLIKSNQDKGLAQKIGIVQSVLIKGGKPVTSISSRCVYVT